MIQLIAGGLLSGSSDIVSPGDRLLNGVLSPNFDIITLGFGTLRLGILLPLPILLLPLPLLLLILIPLILLLLPPLILLLGL